MEELYKIEDAAKMLKCSVSKVRGLINSGKLKYLNLSNGTQRRNFRISKAHLEDFKNNG